MTEAHDRHDRPPVAQVLLPAELDFLLPTERDDLIRIGGAYDGGYVVPRAAVERTNVLISLGINDDWSFDAHFAELRPGLEVHAYDHTISRRGFAERTFQALCGIPLRTSNFGEMRYRAGRYLAYQKFFRGRVTHFAERVHNRADNPNDATLAKIFSRTQQDGVFVKMDIEGAEYRVGRELLNLSDRIVGMVIEFHDVDPYREVFIDLVRELQTKHQIVHTHVNNFDKVSADGYPEVLELTFLRNDLATQGKRRARLPVDGLDAPNNPDAVDYELIGRAPKP